MTETIDPRELQSLQAYYNDYNQQAEVLVRQLEILDDGRIEAGAAIEAINSISEAEDRVVLLQVGGGVSMRVRVEDPDRILLNIGSGVVVERTRDQAAEFLKDRITEMDASSKNVAGMVERIRNQMNEFAKRIELIYQQQGQAGRLEQEA
ncbi:MAG: prefoldin subunit alpha [Methanomicrobiales archaeon]|nr:prefoldin subunit alpha [Methanomicrobiales archaeon]